MRDNELDDDKCPDAAAAQVSRHKTAWRLEQTVACLDHSKVFGESRQHPVHAQMLICLAACVEILLLTLEHTMYDHLL